MLEKIQQHGKEAAGLFALMLLTASFFLVTAGINKIKEFRYIGQAPDYSNNIVMTGQGKVVAVPDIIKLTFGYTITKPKVADAQKLTVDKMNAFMEVLKNKGVDSKDIRTINYSINPQYDYANGVQQLNGYNVSQNVEVKLRDMDLASTILSLAGDNELNQVGSLEFTFDDQEKFLQEARVKAIKNAKEKAETLAKEAGVHLGRIISINENSYPGPVYPMYMDKSVSGLGGGGSAPAPEISAGSSELVVDISLTYELL